MKTVVFDVDGTLIDDQGRVRWAVLDLLRAFHALGWEIGVWSGGGHDYAAHWVNRLGLWEFVSWTDAKDPRMPDIDLCIDDVEGADIGKVTVVV